MPEGEDVPDDFAIPSDCQLLRSFSPQFIVPVQGGGLRPDRRAFQEITDKNTGVRAMSVYRRDLLDELQVEYEAIVETHPDHLIVCLAASKFRELGLGVVSAPEAGRAGPAHCHIFGKLSGSRQSRLVDAVVDGGDDTWIKGPQ